VIGTTLNQRFSLDKELGRGGMGAVYRATDLVLQRPVAIKILKEHAGEEVGPKIRLEAQILARLVHEHIVRIYDFGESNGLYYFVMEEVDGASFLRRSRRLDLAGRLRILADVAEALDYAHHQGVIHRDIKPANVLMTLSDSARLSDFGLSVLMDRPQESGMIRGTPHYMSPEQAKGKRLDHRTDIYSLGVMIYECVTGSPPFTGPTYAVIASQAGATPDVPRSKNPAVSVEVEALILAMMAKSPADRPASGADVARAIRDLLAKDPTLASGSVGPYADGGEGVPTAPTLVARSETSVLPPVIVPEVVGVGLQGAAWRILTDVVAAPITLTADERYLTGHYLAYLLGGSRRKGFLRRRPLDPLNADRARLMLAMTWLMLRGVTDGSLELAAELLDRKPDVRPSLSPVVVAKYLTMRDSQAKRKTFREARRRLQEASTYAREHLTDDRGVLNPGLMPQVLGDLRRIAPARTEVDDQLVERWNRVAEVWRERADFRRAVLGYATTSAVRDPASRMLWPEVVYPLIERARWQRQLRSTPEVLWDQVLGVLHIPEPGNRLDRAIKTVVPSRVVEELDADLAAFTDEPELEAFSEGPAPQDEASRLSVQVDPASFFAMATTDTMRAKGLVRLANPDPVRLTLGELRELWEEGVAGLRNPGSKAGHRNVPVGPYRIAVIPSIRGRSAGEIAIQGMKNKQIEMLTPSLRLAGSSGKPIVAVWHYTDDSLAVAYVDFRNITRYITWHAPTAQQSNHEVETDLYQELFNLGLEPPEDLGSALSKRFRPRNPV
jgi:hypothetical protein